MNAGPAAPEEEAVLAFLAGAEAGFGPTEAVIRTHVSIILLKRDRALKLKRAIRFPYLDYTTPELRLAACEAELALNRRTAPGLYLATHRITRADDGRLALDGEGPLVEALVEMRRFAERDLLDRMAQEGRLERRLMDDLAGAIATFHEKAEPSRAHGGAAGLARVLDINARSLASTGLVEEAEAALLAARFHAALETHAALLDARKVAGKVRRCHGDLILRNICLFEGRPTLFDCIEFNEDLATIDVLYDLAFVLMDLWHRGQGALGNFLLNRYLDRRDELDGIGLLPFLMAIRADVRAHVTAAQARQAKGTAADPLREEALAYLDLAKALLAPASPRLVAIGGLSGTGKSTLAAALAPGLGLPPGARVINSDRLRKAIHGVSAETRLPPEAYRPEISTRVYALMVAEARRALAAGAPVIVDAVFDRPEDRAAIAAIATALGLPFHGLWLTAGRATLEARVAARRNDPSDATLAVLDLQLGHDPGAIAWHALDATGPVEALARAARASIALPGGSHA